MPDWLYQSLTSDIIAAYYAVFHTIEQREAYSEGIFSEALRLELQQRGHAVRAQVTVVRTYRGRCIGRHRIDLLVDNKVALEIKKPRLLKDEHAAQLRAYLVDGGWAVGLLLNFGGVQPELRRLENRESSAYRGATVACG
jgi:GxxExxY protein